MAELAPGIRNAVRAVIIKDGALLVQHKTYEKGNQRYCLPGGAPNPGESLEEGLKRECWEEIGARVLVRELLHVADFHKPRETTPPTKRQQVEFLFRCEVPTDYQAQNGPHPDKHQVDVIWLQFDEIPKSMFFPKAFADILTNSSTDKPVYLGLIE